MRTALPVTLFATLALLASLSPAADEAELAALGQAFAEVQPLVKTYCHKCHSGDKLEAEVDLGSFATFAEVRKHSRVWQKVGEMLDSGQMPPKEAKQPTDAERTKLAGWVRGYLTLEARAQAGDPGRVVLRRLSNVEYTYTLRDLTGVPSLDPAREFPVDGAAGEGFTNTGSALVMSPALVTKYLDAAKDVAAHAVLLPDGIRFSPSTSRSDWTNENLASIREFYRLYSDPGGGERVNLQGIVFDTNQGGRLAVEKYLAATLAEREALAAGKKSLADVARERGLNAKYLGILWRQLTSREPSLLLEGLRAHWRTAKPEEAAAIAAEVAAWQKGLFRFTTVGHIGKVNGPKRWLEPVSPLTARQEIRLKLPPSSDGKEVVFSLVAGDVGDGNEQDYVVWQQPRLVAPGRPELLLRDVRAVAAALAARRARLMERTANYLAAADEAAAAQGAADPAELAKKHNLDAGDLRAWLGYLGIGGGGAAEVKGHYTAKLPKNKDYDFIQGWGSGDTPLVVANSSDQHVRIPGNMKPHSIAVHPSPKLSAAVGWQSPVTANLRIAGGVTHAHPECGNGVTWSLELRRGATRRKLAAGNSQGGTEVKVGPIEGLAVQKGDLVSLLVGPRDGNHSCDLTRVELTLTDMAAGGKSWDLAGDTSGDLLAANPHADRQGNAAVWHFYSEPVTAATETAPVIPPGSVLSRWQASKDAAEKQKLADELQKMLVTGRPVDAKSPDTTLYDQLTSLGGPLFGNVKAEDLAGQAAQPAPNAPAFGLDPALFGKDPRGTAMIDAASICVRAPNVLEVHLPADLAAGCELVTAGVLAPNAGPEASAQLQVIPGKVALDAASLKPNEERLVIGGGAWTSDNRKSASQSPILVADGSAARQRIEKAFDEFRSLFPAALCYTKIVPVDEVVTLTLYYREDDHLCRLMLDDEQKARLDRVWAELHYTTRDALTLVDALEQLIQYATQDADPKVFEPLKAPFAERAAAYRQQLVDTQPIHLTALLDFAGKAYRRPLTSAETRELRGLYDVLRKQDLPHEEAFRLTLARVLVSPAFLYKVERPLPGTKQGPVSDFELASRLSYFLWSSPPDDELRQLAAAGQLKGDKVLAAQTRRMLADPRTRRLATEFGCQWLHIHGFNELDEKSERHFPTFAALRGPMYEESIQFFTDLFAGDRPVLAILDADYTFLNEELAKHYGIPNVKGPQWRRVEGVKPFGRGGILAQATTLAKQSGASRTSPILRGNWVSEVLLGERLPRPPKGVPQLPEDEAATEGLTVRQLVEKHASDAKCSVCHRRIDPLGFALERYDAIGRRRDKDLGDRPIETQVKTIDGAAFDGLDGLRGYLLTTRREAFLRQFTRKLLGYSLGRSVQLADEPLLAEIQTKLKANEFRVGVAVEAIVLSKQFREIRGQDAAYDE